MNTTKNTKRLGKNQKNCLAFYEKYKGPWTFARDRATVDAIKGLERRNLLKVTWSCRVAELA